MDELLLERCCDEKILRRGVGRYALARRSGPDARRVHSGRYAQGSGHRQKPEVDGGQEESHPNGDCQNDVHLERNLKTEAQVGHRNLKTNWSRLELSWAGVSSCLVWTFSSKILGVGGIYVSSLE